MAVDYSKRGDDGAKGGVSLSKVTLTKSAPKVSLTKQSGGGMLRVNLNWDANTRRTGLFGRSTASIDLDLGCLYEYEDGSKGAVQALGDSFRDRNPFSADPIVRLDGDDRSGTNTAGENLFVDLSQVGHVRRILVFAFIYEGVPNWAAANAVVTLFPASGPQIEVRLDEHDPRASMCAIAVLQNVGGELTVQREVRYFDGHSKLDAAYGWGMRWTAGSK
jgi:tellurite resistance protein TerA